MTDLVVENLRLRELVLVVTKNRPFFDEFRQFLSGYGYVTIKDFVSEESDEKLDQVLTAYFAHNFENVLFDGIARPYTAIKSKWFFITWLLRDAPQQRLQPIVSSLTEGTATQKKIWVVKRILRFVAPLLPDHQQWQWEAVSEVMLQRLEGSRRALKGNLFEAIVRTQLKELFKRHKLKLTVTDVEIRLNDETYDVEVIGSKANVLMPVKTRETMGGGHALLFTRDIHKSISVAHESGFNCIPVVIAESWGGNLGSLPCENYIHIPVNPNQVDRINPLLESRLEDLVAEFQKIQ